MNITYLTVLTEEEITKKIKELRKTLKGFRFNSYHKGRGNEIRYIRTEEIKEFEKETNELLALIYTLKSLKALPKDGIKIYSAEK